MQIPGFVFFRQDRGEHKSGGGLSVYVKDTFNATILKDPTGISDENFQQLWIKVQVRQCKSILICTVYRPPSTTSTFKDSLSRGLLNMLLLSYDIIILGDLNCNILDDTADSRTLKDLVASFNPTQLVKEPTSITDTKRSLIDVIMITDPNLAESYSVIMSSISDHNLVEVTLRINRPKAKAKYVTTRSYSGYAPDSFCEDLSLVPWHMVYFFNDIDSQVETFNSLFMDVLDQHAPVKRVKIKSRSNPFVTPEIKQLMKTRDLWHKKAIQTNDKLCWNGYRFFRQEVKRELRLAEKIYVRNEIANSKGNTNATWKILNLCMSRGIAKLPGTFEDHETLVNKFNKYFTSVGELTAKKANLITGEHGLDEDKDCGLREEGIGTGLHAEIEEFEFQEVKEIDVKLVNNSFNVAAFPKVWKIAEVIPVPKEGNPEEAANNRPISLLPILSKVSERLAHKQFVEFLTKYDKLSNYQSGNRKMYATETALINVKDNILKAIDEKAASLLVLLDMSKAFDGLDHNLLLRKLRKLGLNTSAASWFTSYLSSRYQRVRYEDSVSELLPLTNGVPQGSILGPVLFTVYINDLISAITHSQAAAYVDDRQLHFKFPTSDSSSAIVAVNLDLRNISRWCAENSLLINPEKTKLVVVGSAKLLKRLPQIS
ncbi:uncharacterized protein LOC111322975 [Stylophora pistillata]|uniref:uncharacterized protein LOC111322975 n=1 Tax=Stylophora pistillata TaxID=50429 RepID=UPI000C0444E0|nr:uncharacterized protein LOC111322975 [Stylophora pistillata]